MRSDADDKKFYDAMRAGDLPTLHSMVQSGFDVNVPLNSQRITPLHYAVNDMVPIGVFRLLLAAGADVNGRGQLGQTPLHWAARRGLDAERCQLLLDAGADARALTAGSDGGITALHLVSEDDSLHLVDLLISAGADVNAASDKGETALHRAASLGRVDVCRKLVACGATVDPMPATPSPKYLTPFQRAVVQGEGEVAEFFLAECGIRTDQPLVDGKPIESIATREMQEILRKWSRSEAAADAVSEALDSLKDTPKEPSSTLDGRGSAGASL